MSKITKSYQDYIKKLVSCKGELCVNLFPVFTKCKARVRFYLIILSCIGDILENEYDSSVKHWFMMEFPCHHCTTQRERIPKATTPTFSTLGKVWTEFFETSMKTKITEELTTPKMFSLHMPFLCFRAFTFWECVFKQFISEVFLWTSAQSVFRYHKRRRVGMLSKAFVIFYLLVVPCSRTGKLSRFSP